MHAGQGNALIDGLYEEIFDALDGPAPCGDDPELFFEKSSPPEWVRAICEACSARDQCAAYALASGERYGMWGAVTERQRNALRRKQKEQGSHYE